MRPLAAVAAVIAFGLCATPAEAHRLNVFASADCDTVRVEAKFSNGRRPVSGEVRVKDADEALLATLALGEDGELSIPLASLDHAGGLLIEVESGRHEDYWVLTPEDLAQGCAS